jgi:Pyruvate/2-oxoacid:ferredoxin oxidoreductase gamma subunit
VVPKAVKTSAPVKFLRGNRASKDLGKTYWARILSRRDVMSTIDQADVVVALDAGAIWAGWNLGQRKASTPVVLGIPAARRELDMLKAPAGNG